MKKPQSFDELYPGKYLKAESLQGKQWTLTIADVNRVEIEGADGEKTPEAVVTFRETPRLWVAPITMGRCLRAMFGPAIRDWVGKRVTLFPEAGVYFGERGEAIRVFGSPDIDADITFMLKVGRNKKVSKTMKATGTAPEIPPEAEQGAMTDEQLEELY